MENLPDTLGNYPELAIWLALFAIVAYLYFTESAFESFLVYVVDYLRSLLYRVYTTLRLSPKSPIFIYYKLRAARNADRAARKMAKERGLDKDLEWNQ
jgi:hypothetical protein